MTESDGGRDTRVVPVKGRSIVVRQLTDAQQMLMMREARVLQGDSASTTRKLEGIGRIFDMLESVVVQQSDKDFLTAEVVAGNLEMTEILGFITVFGEDEAEKPKVRRGRPPRVRV